MPRKKAKSKKSGDKTRITRKRGRQETYDKNGNLKQTVVSSRRRKEAQTEQAQAVNDPPPLEPVEPIEGVEPAQGL